MILRDAAPDDCAFLASLFEGDEYEQYFAENDTTEAEWRELIGSGIGYKAFHAAISGLPKCVMSVRLDVQRANRHALAFYERYGFCGVGEELQPVGERTELYYKMEFNRKEI